MKARLITFLKFCLVGGLNSAVDYGISNALRYLTGAESWLATAIGYAAGSVCSYLLNGQFTFKTRGKIINFAVINVISLAVSILLTRLWEVAGLGAREWYWLTKAMTMCVTFAVNFVGYRFFVFKTEDGEVK